VECFPGNPGDQDREDDGGEETDTVESPLGGGLYATCPGCEGSNAAREGTEVDVHECSGEHSNPRRDEIAAEPHPGEPQAVVEQVIGKEGRETQEEDHRGSFPADGLVDGVEARIIHHFPGDPFAGKMTSDEKGKRSPGHGSERDDHGSLEWSEENTGCHRDEESRDEEDGGGDVESGKSDRGEERIESFDVLQEGDEEIFDPSAEFREQPAQ